MKVTLFNIMMVIICFHLCYQIREAWRMDPRIPGSKTDSDLDLPVSAQDPLGKVHVSVMKLTRMELPCVEDIYNHHSL